MSINDDKKKKITTSSGGGYKPLHDVEMSKPQVREETVRERAERQRRERRAELTYTAEDHARWARNRERVLAERRITQAEVDRKVTSWLFPLPSADSLKEKVKNVADDFDLDEVLANPELAGIKSVNIDPVSMAVETAVDLIEDAKAFVKKPSLSGIASMAMTAVPGKYAEKIVDELPLKKLDKAMAKSLRTMKRFKVPCFEPGATIKGKFKGKERELESHFARQLKIRKRA